MILLTKSSSLSKITTCIVIEKIKDVKFASEEVVVVVRVAYVIY